ncbi:MULTISPECIES: hemerythrin domain-containing protein [Protofrankia]|uniref:Hemerythrin n=1 Tax=Protofrankia coriariae TaxID=1562887 RepID=A0ABR5F1Q6_9ACTN|nr:MULTISPECIES: hemerythrin domain-containing protein [Protofrankia]KLL10642.1 hemerythrin [Protofrankia coriariae]ONH35077.1 hemerythrin [Protofrankia sp. BMG5.30]
MTTSEAEAERARAAQLPDDDVVGVLLLQHARIRDLFADVRSTTGEHKRQAFDELRALLAVHETAEEMVLRPVTAKIDRAVAEARNREEDEATRVLKTLEKMDVNSGEFDRKLAEFEQAVAGHAEHEESEEFPRVRAARTEDQLEHMGRRLRTAEKIAPTHPHPSTAGSPAAQWTVGPVASIIDRARDAVR